MLVNASGLKKTAIPGLLWLAIGLPAFAIADENKSRSGEESQRKTRADWAEIELKGAYPESNALPGLFAELEESLPACMSRLRQAARNKSLKGVILHINDVQIGWARLNELREAIDEVQAAGKPVWARMNDAGNMDYLLAATCDRILMPESGTLMLTGLRAEVTFYRNLFEMLDIQADMLRVGAFKSAAEPYTRTEMSDEFRQEMEGILDDYFATMVEIVSEGRGLSAEAVAPVIDEGVLTPERAKELKLIDEIAYEDQLQDLIAAGDASLDVRILRDYRKKKLSTELDLFTLMQLLAGTDADSGSTRPRIAVIRLEGAIVSGADPLSLLMESSINSDRIVPLIHKLSKDDNLKAIVLRVDSPGGSALASDLIWRALEASGKPVVVSMGDTAASGGYYISMGADAIYAEPGTLTGSIGVIGGKIAFDGLMKKVGVTTSVIRRGKNSGILSMTQRFTDSEREAMQKMLDAIYSEFTEKAAAGRKMELEQLEPLARGRVYTGRQAKELGLVDEIGTLADAIAHARKLAGDDGDKLELEDLPKPQSPLEMLMGTAQSPQPFDAWARSVPESLQPAVRHLNALRVLASEPVNAILPFHIRID